jgi:hypothetical protein
MRISFGGELWDLGWRDLLIAVTLSGVAYGLSRSARPRGPEFPARWLPRVLAPQLERSELHHRDGAVALHDSARHVLLPEHRGSEAPGDPVNRAGLIHTAISAPISAGLRRQG